jgi:2',3'-cyclic-nucleotide 2'-phosphodiesterase (5'-nucleotidase family)
MTARDKVVKCTLRFLCINDVYKPSQLSLLKALKKQFGRGPEFNAINLNCMDTSDEHVVTTKTMFAGDLLGGSMFAAVHKGESMIEVCNAVDFDYICLGNHEFDYGASRTRELMEMSEFAWVGSNVRNTDDGDLFGTTLDVDTFEVPFGTEANPSNEYVKVGVFGLCTRETPHLSHPTNSVMFEDTLVHARRCVNLLREFHQCDVVVALTHMSNRYDMEIADMGGIDLIMGGHDHEPLIMSQNGTLITKAGQNMEYLGIADLHMTKNPTTGKVEVLPAYQLYSLDSRVVSIDSDPAVDEIVAKWEAKMETASKGISGREDHEVLCVVGSDHGMTTKCSSVRATETAFACHLADAFVYSYKVRGLACDVGMINGGFVRGDSDYPKGSTVTVGLIGNELPFECGPVLIKASGAKILLGIDQMLPVPKGNSGAYSQTGAWPHISAGLKAEYDLSLPPGSRVFNAYIGGEPIDLEREYDVAVSDFYAIGTGDGVDAFSGSHIVSNHKMRGAECMVEYLPTLPEGIMQGKAPGSLRRYEPEVTSTKTRSM